MVFNCWALQVWRGCFCASALSGPAGHHPPGMGQEAEAALEDQSAEHVKMGGSEAALMHTQVGAEVGVRQRWRCACGAGGGGSYLQAPVRASSGCLCSAFASPVPSEIPAASLRSKAPIPVHINCALCSINLCINQHRVAGCPLPLALMYLLEMLRMMLSCSWADPLPSQDCLPSL